MIASKNLFLVGSALKPSNSPFFNNFQRFEQTIMGLKSIRAKAPDAIIVLSDCSIVDLTNEEKEELLRNTDVFVDMSKHYGSRALGLSQVGAKSQAETVLIADTLAILKGQNWYSDVKRVFKFSARTLLLDDFDISEYDNLFGKYVFKKRIPSWMNNPELSDLLITRMFSFCTSLTDNYFQVMNKNWRLLDRMDTEHAHFQNIPREYLVEFDELHCSGWLSGNGQVEKY